MRELMTLDQSVDGLPRQVEERGRAVDIDEAVVMALVKQLSDTQGEPLELVRRQR